METYPPTFLSSSSPPPHPPPFMAMMNSHHRADSKVIQDDELVSSGGWFLGLKPPSIMGGHEAPTTSNDNNVVVEGLACGHDSRDKSSVLEGSSMNTGRWKKGDATTKGKKARKQRYAFQTRSHVDILDDGYRWRKYGQKAVKNNKFPRSYYRCTAQGCNVKKQVQRLTRDEGIVITTYEGMHSHPIEKSTDNFEHILSQFRIYTST